MLLEHQAHLVASGCCIRQHRYRTPPCIYQAALLVDKAIFANRERNGKLNNTTYAITLNNQTFSQLCVRPEDNCILVQKWLFAGVARVQAEMIF